MRLKALLENLPLRFALVLQYLFGLSQEPSPTSFTSASEHADGVYTRPAVESRNPSLNSQLRRGDLPGF